MNHQQIMDSVISVLSEIQEQSGRSSFGISESTVPFEGLDGFDSINAVEATLLLESRLDCGELGFNPFLPGCREQPSSVAEIVDGICHKLGIEGERANE